MGRVMNWYIPLDFNVVDLIVLSLIGFVMVLAYKRRVDQKSFRSISAHSIIFIGLLVIAFYALLDLAFNYAQRLAIAVQENELPFTNFSQYSLEFLYLMAFTFVSAVFLLITKMIGQYKDFLNVNDSRLQMIVENQHEFIIRWKPGGIRTWVNDAYCNYHQQPRESLIGTSFFPAISEAVRHQLEAQISDLK